MRLQMRLIILIREKVKSNFSPQGSIWLHSLRGGARKKALDVSPDKHYVAINFINKFHTLSSLDRAEIYNSSIRLA